MPLAPGCKHKPKKGSTIPFGHGEDTEGRFQVRKAFCKKCRTWYVVRVNKDEDENASKYRH